MAKARTPDRPKVRVRPKGAGLAAVFSFLIPGLGQVYNGQFLKAFGFIVGTLASGMFFQTIIGPALLVVLWVWGILDAYRSAERMNGVRVEDGT